MMRACTGSMGTAYIWYISFSSIRIIRIDYTYAWVHAHAEVVVGT